MAAPGWRVLRIGRWLSWRLDRRALPVLAALALALLGLAVLSAGVGEYRIGPVEVLRAVLGSSEDGDHRLVVRVLRLPRVALGALVGAALAVSGALLQGLSRNALADPGVLGVTQGAALAAVAVLTTFRSLPLSALPWAAFAGGTLTAALIYAIAWRGGAAPLRLLLVGVGVSAALTALTSIMVVFGEINQVQQAFVWLAGSLFGRGWAQVRLLLVWVAVLLPLALMLARPLDLLGLGDGPSRGLGLRLEASRAAAGLVAVALAAGAVAAAGTVGFVGLVAPHAARRLVGGHHAGLIPASALLGAVMVVLADLVGRTVIAPNQLPAGLMTAIVGAPYFMVLLWRQGRR